MRKMGAALLGAAFVVMLGFWWSRAPTGSKEPLPPASSQQPGDDREVDRPMAAGTAAPAAAAAASAPDEIDKALDLMKLPGLDRAKLEAMAKRQERQRRRAPAEIGSEGYGPHLLRAAESGDLERIEWAVDTLMACAMPEADRRTLHDTIRERQFGGPWLAKLTLEALDHGSRLCQTVTAEHRALGPALSLRLVEAQRPGAVRRYEHALGEQSRQAARRHELGELHRAAVLRADQDSLSALAELGSLYGLEEFETRAYGYLAQHCFPLGLETHSSGQPRPFVFMEDKPELIAALKARGLSPFPPPDPALVRRAQARAAELAAQVCPGRP